jgi:hypothetical protein
MMPFFPTHKAIIIINSFNSLTPMVADMRPPKLLASWSLNNFSIFCPVTTFDS